MPESFTNKGSLCRLFNSERRIQLRGTPGEYALSLLAEVQIRTELQDKVQSTCSTHTVQLVVSRAMPLIVAAKPLHGTLNITAFTGAEVYEVVQQLQHIERLNGCLDGFSMLMVPSPSFSCRRERGAAATCWHGPFVRHVCIQRCESSSL